MASTGFGPAFRHLRKLFEGRAVASLEDGQLLARFEADRDEAAFEALVGRHGPMVLTICRAVLKNEHDVEDAFQATFLVLAKKARSIRGADALGGWLHRVAYRASVQASAEARRRRRKEAEASAMAWNPSSRPDPEIAAVLHEEIDRLPEGQRLPVVLCDLEGLTYDQAARQLRWTVPTLRNRLARGRQRLKARLTRRGVMAPAIGALLAEQALAAVPPSLVRLTVSAATGGTTSGGVALLTQNLLRGMFMAKLKIASTAALMALALASAGLIAGAGRPDDPKPAMKPAASPRAEVGKAQSPTMRPGEPIEVRGIVVGPSGRPVAGATLAPSYYDSDDRPEPAGTSGPDGRFSIRVARSKRQAGWVDAALFPWLIASKPGFGPGWASGVPDVGRAGDLTIRLVEEGSPIEGRVIDLEGRPVAGARVEVSGFRFVRERDGRVGDSGDLSPWLARLRQSGASEPWEGTGGIRTGPSTIPPATTGPDGRFRLVGVGRERVANLMIAGPSIASTNAYAMTRDEPEVRVANETFLGPKPIVFHSPRFDQPVAPGKPIRGIARDKDTGRPIAGLKIQAAVFDPRSVIPARGVEATTDPEGRYTLTGLPKAPAYRVFASWRPGLPYANAVFRADASDSPRLDPVTFDFTLKRGVLVRGRVTDKATGLPVRGQVNAYTFADSPLLGEYPGTLPSHAISAYLDDDGRYEVVALPGRAIIACQSDIRRYRAGLGAEAIAGYDARIGTFKTVPSFQGAINFNVMAEIRLDPEDESATMDLQVDPGRTVALDVLDPEGHPIGDLKADGTSERLLNLPITEASSTVEVRCLDPSRPRRVVVSHEGRKLVGSIWLKGDESGPVPLRLRPWGVVTGRIVDDGGNSGRFRTIMAGNNSPGTRPEEDGIFPGGTVGAGVPIGKDGRFHLEGLVPGLKYGAVAGAGELSLGQVFLDVTVSPGEVKDLGDLKVRPFQPGKE